MISSWYGIFVAFILLSSLLVASIIIWRYAVRRRALPCPEWLIPLLENPYMESFAGSSLLLDRASVQRGMNVLDVGCGPGRLAIPAAERVGPSGRVLAMDIQQNMLRRVEERMRKHGVTNIQLVHAGAGEGSLEQQAFDRAFLVTVLGEIPSRAEALREIHAALKEGGILSITEVLPDPHYQRQASVRALAEGVGFAVDEVFAMFPAYTMNLRKGSDA